ncbi:hypothetical protein BDW75DRAFT_221099 [Aspergillus navahoensis]
MWLISNITTGKEHRNPTENTGLFCRAETSELEHDVIVLCFMTLTLTALAMHLQPSVRFLQKSSFAKTGLSMSLSSYLLDSLGKASPEHDDFILIPLPLPQYRKLRELKIVCYGTGIQTLFSRPLLQVSHHRMKKMWRIFSWLRYAERMRHSFRTI